MTKRRWLKWGLAILGLMVLAAGAVVLPRVLAVGAAYKAKLACSGVLVAGRDIESLQKNELDMLGFIPVQVDREQGLVSASLFGLGIARRTAVHLPGLGCTIAGDAGPAALAGRSAPLPPHATNPAPWPQGQGTDPSPMPEGLDGALLQRAMTQAFSQPDPARPLRTRAVVVVHRGRLLAERYAPGFSAQTPQLGWSMAKSVNGALLGVMVARGKLSLDMPAPVPQWRKPGDERSQITLGDLLYMQSGLQWKENYTSPWSNVLSMLFMSPSAGAYAAQKPQAQPPGSTWMYSSGTANIISGIIRRAMADDKAYWALPRTALFDPLGMNSAVLETDPDGGFVGSSFMYASARDWARFGQLYLQDGLWQGTRILPAGWAALAAKPAQAAPEGIYGGQWWLNAGHKNDAANRKFPGLPADLFWAQGHEGQYVCVIPSHQAVVVRLGLSRHDKFDLAGLLKGVLAALPQ